MHAPPQQSALVVHEPLSVHGPQCPPTQRDGAQHSLDDAHAAPSMRQQRAPTFPPHTVPAQHPPASGEQNPPTAAHAHTPPVHAPEQQSEGDVHS
jgi:hypothetical protein